MILLFFFISCSSDDASQYSNKRLKKGPPRKSNGKYNVQGTSRGCLKENITDSVFDYYWSEVNVKKSVN